MKVTPHERIQCTGAICLPGRQIETKKFKPDQGLETFCWTPFHVSRVKVKFFDLPWIFIKPAKILPYSLNCLTAKFIFIKQTRPFSGG